jgi:hypothetical protein
MAIISISTADTYGCWDRLNLIYFKTADYYGDLIDEEEILCVYLSVGDKKSIRILFFL